MDITTTSRSHFSTPALTPEEKISLAASSTVYTYHCLCTHLLLATSTPLAALPVRKNSLDTAHIMPLPPPPPPATTVRGRGRSQSPEAPPPNDHYGLLLSTRLDGRPEMVTSDEGFEKRYLQRCGRCNLVVGYQLDWQQFVLEEAQVEAGREKSGRREDVVYLLPGGFVTTSEMVLGKAPRADGLGVVTVAEVKV